MASTKNLVTNFIGVWPPLQKAALKCLTKAMPNKLKGDETPPRGPGTFFGGQLVLRLAGAPRVPAALGTRSHLKETTQRGKECPGAKMFSCPPRCPSETVPTGPTYAPTEGLPLA